MNSETRIPILFPTDMALSNDYTTDGSQPKNVRELYTTHGQLSVLYNRLKRSINYARRCSEGFRTAQWKWSLLRLKIAERLTYLCDVTQICAHELFLETATQLLDDLPQDKEMAEELFTIFNEYLDYATDIKKLIENTEPNNLSEIIFNLAKEQYPELLPRIKIVESSQERLKVFDLISVLDLGATTTTARWDDLLSKTVELLKFLSFHWGIIRELSSIDQNRGPVQDINLFPEKFLDCAVWEDKKPTYYDLVSNFSVSSAVKCSLNALLTVSAEEWLQQAYVKLNKLQKAVDNRTKRMSLLLELMISET